MAPRTAVVPSRSSVHALPTRRWSIFPQRGQRTFIGERAWKHFPQWLRFVKAEGSSNSDANMVCRQSKNSGDQLLIERATEDAAIPTKERTGGLLKCRPRHSSEHQIIRHHERGQKHAIAPVLAQ